MMELCFLFLLQKVIPYFSDYKMHSPAPHPIWEENGGASYSPNVAYLAHWVWGSSGGAGSQGAGVGSLLQEAGGCRSGAMLRALGWEEGVSRPCEAREAEVESLLPDTI